MKDIKQKLLDGARKCYYVPADAYVEEHGYRVSIVVEGEAGHHPTGTWPYTGAPGESMPWFWGHDYAEAKRICDMENARMGLSIADSIRIVSSSMGAN